MPLRSVSSVSVVLLVACARVPGGPGDDVDLPGGDPDHPGDGGDDTPTPQDSDLPPQDSDLPPLDSDLPPLDSAEDTFRYADTDVPTDTAPDTDPGPITPATPDNLHDGLYTPGQLLSFPPLVVTATRFVARPPASNGFAVQEPNGTAPGSGLYVDVKDAQVLPAVGDLVQIVGSYDEWPQHAAIGSATMARITVHASLPLTSWTKVGTAALPTPVPLRLADVADPAKAEDWEGMLVRVAEAGRLSVTRNPSYTYQEFQLGTGGTSILVDPWFFDYTQTMTVRVGGSVSAMVGVMWYEPTSHKITPRSAADFVGWTP